LWNDEQFNLGNGKWEVVLLLDNREQRTRNDRTYFRDRIHERGIKCEVRTLPLGDMLWIVRKKKTAIGFSNDLPSQEWILHFIIERKRVDDLASSIMDGRYFEQKYRLKKSNLKKVMYLVEGDLAQQDKMSPSQLEMAIIETEVTEGFYTHQTQHAGDTVDFLCGLHSQIVSAVLVHSNQRIGEYSKPFMPYAEFSKLAAKVSKSSTIQDIFGKILRQLPRCGSVQAHAIMNIYPTIGHLIKAYSKLNTDAEKSALLANIKPKGRSRLGNALSSTAYFFFRGRTY
jgi:crossover junction endonuclease MUS81